jgi:hypothetical protein
MDNETGGTGDITPFFRTKKWRNMTFTEPQPNTLLNEYLFGTQRQRNDPIRAEG